MEDYGIGYCSSKRLGQIPVFGDWEYADEMPITQYFENARQAGLMNRYSSSGGRGSDERSGGDGDGLKKVRTRPTDHQNQRRCPQAMSGSDDDMTPKKPPVQRSNAGGYHHCYAADTVSTYPRPTLKVVRAAKGTAKPVDEDLYKIPPELMCTTKRKKMLGYFPRCLVPGCGS